MTIPESQSESALGRLLLVSRTVLSQATDILKTSIISDSQLVFPSKHIPASTIGKHLRHATDHFQLLLACISQPSPIILCFDVRVRNVPMESSRHSALATFDNIQKQLDNLPSNISLDSPLTLNAVTPFEQILETTFGRELWFCVLHALHHWALVKVIASEMDISLPDDFGYAPSTLLYREREGPLGKARL